MRIIFLISIIISVNACGTPTSKTKNVIGPPEVKTETITTIPQIDPIIYTPSGAVFGDYNGDNTSFYAFVRAVDRRSETMVIAFENRNISPIIINKTYGGMLSTLRLEGFDRDLLLVTTKLKDPIFNKYYLYVLRNNQWSEVVNGFAIHQSHFDEVPNPIFVDPSNNENLLRYYSVFDLDQTSVLGYTWRLFSESIPIKNR